MKIRNYIYPAAFLVASLLVTSCSPDEAGNGNGLTDSTVDASFTITPVEGANNTYTVESATPGVLASRWNFGKVEGNTDLSNGKMKESIFFPDAGTYTIIHGAIGRGGAMNTASQEIVVATSDPASGNLTRGGKLNTAADISEWSILDINNATNAAVVFANGKATFTAGGYQGQAIYQAIEVEAGKKYKIDMYVSTAGVGNTWFEVYASKTAPTGTNDYNADGIKMQLNTWAGCGNNALSGWLSTVGCGGSGAEVTFPTSGTMYLVIKSGGEFNTGISVDNIEFRGVAE